MQGMKKETVELHTISSHGLLRALMEAERKEEKHLCEKEVPDFGSPLHNIEVVRPDAVFDGVSITDVESTISAAAGETTNPFEDTRLAKFVARRVKELGPKKSQRQIAKEAGYPNSNMVAMVKAGARKLALDRVPSLANALECDSTYLMHLALEQAVGKLAAQAAIEALKAPVTKNEVGWLKVIREASDSSDPQITSKSRATIMSIFGK